MIYLTILTGFRPVSLISRVNLHNPCLLSCNPLPNRCLSSNPRSSGSTRTAYTPACTGVPSTGRCMWGRSGSDDPPADPAVPPRRTPWPHVKNRRQSRDRERQVAAAAFREVSMEKRALHPRTNAAGAPGINSPGRPRRRPAILGTKARSTRCQPRIKPPQGGLEWQARQVRSGTVH